MVEEATRNIARQHPLHRRRPPPPLRGRGWASLSAPASRRMCGDEVKETAGHPAAPAAGRARRAALRVPRHDQRRIARFERGGVMILVAAKHCVARAEAAIRAEGYVAIAEVHALNVRPMARERDATFTVAKDSLPLT